MWIYENHLGGLFASEDEIPFDKLFCETCGDSDYCLGNFTTAKEFIESFANEIDWPIGSGGYYLEYIIDFINESFSNDLSKEDVIKLIEANKNMEEFEDE